MEFSQITKPSLWGALVWKDFQQVKQTFAAVLIALFFAQLVLMVAANGTIEEFTKQGFLQGTILCASIAPILLAIGCSGMLVGQERQSGTWAWSSSLPVAWQTALLSKLSISLLGTLAATIPLTIVPLSLWYGGQFTPTVDSIATVYSFGLSFLVFLEVTVFCYLTTLLMRETLTAIAAAGMGLLALHLVLGLTDIGGVLRGEFSFVYALIINLAVGTIVMVVTFAWRWRIGQQATLFSQKGTIAVGPPSKMAFLVFAQPAPSEWRVMLSHSFANSFWLRGCCFVGSILSTLTIDGGTPSFVGVIAILILGVSVFDGDQTLNRFRFLADRGITPWKLAVSRMIVVLPWVFLVMLFGMIAPNWKEAYNGEYVWGLLVVASTGTLAFLVGALASLCFRKSVVAITVAMVGSIVAVAATVLFFVAIESSMSYAVPQLTMKLSKLLVLGVPFSVLVLVVSIVLLCKQWIVLESAKLARHFAWIVPVSLLLPVTIASTFGFLTVPVVEWQGDKTDRSVYQDAYRQMRNADTKLESSAESFVPIEMNPPWFDLSKPWLSSSIGNLRNLAYARNGTFEQIAQTSTGVMNEIQEELELAGADTSQSAMAVLESRMPDVVEAISKSQNSQYGDPLLDNKIARVAAMATLALRGNDPELSLALWRSNRELQEIAAGSPDTSLLRTYASRSVSMFLLNQLSDSEVEKLGGRDVLASLIPSEADERAALMQETRSTTSNQRLVVWGYTNQDGNTYNYPQWNIVSQYPPLRWFAERELALELDLNLQGQRLLHKNYITYLVHAPLVARFAGP
jgi:hypothetical protein